MMLIAAGGPEDKAREAAIAAANNDVAIAGIKGGLKLFKGMAGVNAAATVGVLLKLPG